MGAVGRPSVYEKEWKDKLHVIEGWARDGLTDEQIAHNMGVGLSTLYDYKNRYKEFNDALKKNKEVIDYQVENALLKRALGYKYTEITKELRKDPNTGEEKLTTVKEIIKEMPPDTTAQIFWLKNRKPAEWREKKHVDVSGDLEIDVTLEDDE